MTIGSVRVPVVSYGPTEEEGVDQVTLEIPSSLSNLGEADLICHVRGRVSNAVQVHIGQAELRSPERWEVSMTPATLKRCVILIALSGGLRAEPYHWDLPKGFPRPRVPAGNLMSEAKVNLGRYLFYDTRLSVSSRNSRAGLATNLKTGLHHD